MKKVFCFLCVLSVLTACKKEDVLEQEVSLGESVKMIVDQPVQVHIKASDSGKETDLSLVVTGLNDSRCPSDVTCIWYGNAVVDVKLEAPGVAPATAALCLGQCAGQVFKEKDETTVDVAGSKYKITLLEVNPYPSTKNANEQRYAVLQVDKVL